MTLTTKTSHIVDIGKTIDDYQFGYMDIQSTLETVCAAACDNSWGTLIRKLLFASKEKLSLNDLSIIRTNIKSQISREKNYKLPVSDNKFEEIATGTWHAQLWQYFDFNILLNMGATNRSAYLISRDKKRVIESRNGNALILNKQFLSKCTNLHDLSYLLLLQSNEIVVNWIISDSTRFETLDIGDEDQITITSDNYKCIETVMNMKEINYVL